MSTTAGFDFSELSDFDREILEKILEEYPKDAKKLMQKAGNAFRRDLRARYRAETKKKTGNLLRGIDRGRPYLYKGEEWQIRVYNKANHAHLIEHGHNLLPWGKKPKNPIFVEGRHIAGKTNNAFQAKFADLVDNFTDELLDKGFR